MIVFVKKTILIQIIGRQKNRRMGKTGALPYLQKVDYTYNSLGWLTGINSPAPPTYFFTNPIGNLPALSSPNTSAADLDNNDLFSMDLKYDLPVQALAPSGTTATPQYGGNISQVVWQVRGREKQAYTLSYDAINRMTNAKYSDINNSGVVTGGRYDETLTYDMRGNIQTLQRNGLTSVAGAPNPTWGLIDNLSYNYGSSGYNITNKLSTVTDNSGNLTKGFKTSANGSAYSYDNNGNMTADPNKGITGIQYNHMNLPTTITFTNSRSIAFVYDAGGNKLSKTVVQNGVTQYKQDYVGGIEYRTASGTTTLEAIYHAEGRVTTINGSLKYEYALKDHLGNTRLMFSDKNSDGYITQSTGQEANEVTQENHYYSFGLAMEGTWSNTPSVSDSKYTYNGKELNDDFGLGLMDYGARMYDAAIGRWNVIDPWAEKMSSYSPYNYAFGNPMRFIDPNGMAPGDFLDENGKPLGSDGINDQKTYVVKTSEKTTEGYNTDTNKTENVKTDGISKNESKDAKAFVMTNSGNKSAFEGNPSIYKNFVELPNQSTRDQIEAIVDTDNGKGGTLGANNQEHGGQIREVRNNDGSKTGKSEVVQSPSSPIKDPAKGGGISIEHTIDSRTTSLFHGHPSGTNGSSKFVQGPSVQDIQGATDKKGNPINCYQFGMGNQKVYIYSTKGVQAIIDKKGW